VGETLSPVGEGLDAITREMQIARYFTGLLLFCILLQFCPPLKKQVHIPPDKDNQNETDETEACIHWHSISLCWVMM
jgi:hypothetical protein